MRLIKWLKKLPRMYLIIGGIVILLATGVTVFSSRNKKEPVQLVTVQKQSIREVVSTSGVLTGKNTVNLKFRSAGRLSFIDVKVGDSVQSGQSISGLDTQEMAIALRQAQNSYAAKAATVDNIHDQLKGHDSDETFAQRDTRTTAEQAANNAYDGVKAAQRAFQDAVILSPISGTITQVNFVPRQNISSADTIAQVVDFSEVYFDADVDEADIGKVKVDQKAEVVLNAYESLTFFGKVAQVLPQTKTTSSGATVVAVRIKLDSTDINLIPNLNGQVNIVTAEKANVLTVPVETLRDDSSVIVKTNKGFYPVEVTPGIKSDSSVEISLGLKEGDQVVKNPTTVNLGRSSPNFLSRITRSITGGGRRF